MRLVIDANVVVQIQISGGLLGPLREHELIGPTILRSEAVSAIREQVYRGEIPADRGRGFVERLDDLPITIHEPVGFLTATWEVAERLGWANTYDAEYVALGLLLDVPIVTLDLRLQRGAGHLVTVITPTEL